MKKSVALILTLAALSLTAPVAVHAKAKPAAKQAGVATAKLKISGMHCEGCAMGITRQVEKVKGVKTARIDHAKSLGVIEYDPATCKPNDLLAAVKKSGYKASLLK